MGETVEGQGGMVVAPHRAAAEAGAAVLREGGNALEAMIAAAATIAVVYPHMNGIGGDVFLLVAEPGREPRGVDACGAAGSFATIERYHAKGYDAVPARGPDAALTVAGAVSGWALAAEIAEALGGRIPRRELLADAVRRAKEGIVVSRSQARMTEEHLDELAPVPGFAGQFLVDGKPPEAGARMVQERLADTLEQIAHTGLRRFLPRRHRRDHRCRPRGGRQPGHARRPCQARSQARQAAVGAALRLPRSSTCRRRPRGSHR